MKKTFEQLIEIDTMVADLYEKTPELKETKFFYAYDKFYKNNILPTRTEYYEKLQEIRLDNALEDKTTGKVLTDERSPRGFSYSKEGLKACIKSEKALYEQYMPTEIEIKPFISSYYPPEISEQLAEELSGLVL